MRFLANENVTGTVIGELRQHGHDVFSVKESMRSERDDMILSAHRQKSESWSRTTKTSVNLPFDLDFPRRAASSCTGCRGRDRMPITDAFSTRSGVVAIGQDISRSSPTREFECGHCRASLAAIGYMTDAVVYRPYATVARPSLPELGSGTKTCKARDMQRRHELRREVDSVRAMKP